MLPPLAPPTAPSSPRSPHNHRPAPSSTDPECIQLDELDSISFGAGLGNDIWKPDLEFKESVGVDKVARDGFWIAPSGRVWWARKMFLTLSCRMSFANMPYDTQHCPITLTGYQHTGSEIELKIPYDVEGSSRSAVTAPIFFHGPIHAACQTAGSLEWMMTDITGNASSSKGGGDSAASSTSINYDIRLTRSPNFVRNNAVFPTILVVFVAWTSFFIERGAVPARVAVVLIAYLTVSGITSTVTATLPRSPEPAWVITMLWMSRIFVFLAIFEYAIANYLKRAEGRITKAMEALKKRDDVESNETPTTNATPPDQFIKEVSKRVTKADRKLLVATTKPGRSIQGHDELKMRIRDQDVDIFCTTQLSNQPSPPFLAPTPAELRLGQNASKTP